MPAAAPRRRAQARRRDRWRGRSSRISVGWVRRAGRGRDAPGGRGGRRGKGGGGRAGARGGGGQAGGRERGGGRSSRVAVGGVRRPPQTNSAGDAGSWKAEGHTSDLPSLC